MVACGQAHTLVLTAAGHVWGCGLNLCFQVGVQSMANPDAIDNSNILFLQMMPPAQFDDGNGHTEIAFIAASKRHSVAVCRHNGVLWTWGQGGGGDLDTAMATLTIMHMCRPLYREQHLAKMLFQRLLCRQLPWQSPPVVSCGIVDLLSSTRWGLANGLHATPSIVLAAMNILEEVCEAWLALDSILSSSRKVVRCGCVAT